MTRLAGPLRICGLACWSLGAHAQAGATAPSLDATSSQAWSAEPTFAAGPRETAAQPAPAAPSAQAGKPPTSEEICHTIEQSAAENGLPVEFFAKVSRQERRFQPVALSHKGGPGTPAI